MKKNFGLLIIFIVVICSFNYFAGYTFFKQIVKTTKPVVNVEVINIVDDKIVKSSIIDTNSIKGINVDTISPIRIDTVQNGKYTIYTKTYITTHNLN